jgi:adenylate kinase
LYQRSDDQDEEAIHKRLEIFFHESILLLKYYESQGKLIEVDGNQDIEQVGQAMVKALEAYLAVKQQDTHRP